ncbi:MAG: hypothetical protein KBH86_13635 [Syntrophorhabdus sp.]|nr:hypothetical protein [Syntrophorhabdus sp.]
MPKAKVVQIPLKPKSRAALMKLQNEVAKLVAWRLKNSRTDSSGKPLVEELEEIKKSLRSQAKDLD